jgi:hypothetical protein
MMLAMQISVLQKGYTEPVTTQRGYFEDGEFILEECDHAGAQIQEFTANTWWEDAHMYVPDGSVEYLQCDKPNWLAVYYEGEGWRID